MLHESLLTLLLLALLFPAEVFWAADFLQRRLVESADIDFGRGGNDISSVHAAYWYAVDLEGSGDEECAFFQVLQENDSLATETAGEKDKDGARFERCSWLRLSDSLARL